MRTFELHRDVDHSGLSGTGVVAEGVEFGDGTAVVRWREVEGEHYDRGVRATTVVFPSVAAVEALHGHGGATRLVWVGVSTCHVHIDTEAIVRAIKKRNRRKGLGDAGI